MIQELLTGVVLDHHHHHHHHRKLSIPPSLLLPDCTTTTSSSSTPSSTPSSPSPSPSPSLPPSSSPCSPAPDQRENLRCPRCDSSNTKFCYYNNYNLTQPRHFCKTCRRYWTKGGALRNVPIGGGCRKTKPSLSSTSASIKSAVTKPKPCTSTSTLDVVHDMSSNYNPLLWSSPSSPHLLALLRSTTNTTSSPFQNPNPNNSTTTFNLHDHPSLNQLGISTSTTPSPLIRNQFSFQAHQQQQENQQVLFNSNDHQLQDLYQRLRSSATHYSDHLQALMAGTSTTHVTSNNGIGGGGGGGGGGSLMVSGLTTPMATTTSTHVATNNSTGINIIPPPILEPLPVSQGDFSYWNPALAWSDLHSGNGAFP